MGIEANFTQDSIRQRFGSFLDMVQEKQIDRMKMLGEKCLIEARLNKGYMMQTGALLSSTGYQVFVDGVAVHSQFDAASGAESNAAAKGMDSGIRLAERIGRDTQGVCLVVVAGMHYAAYVEARGRNVLSSAEHLAERELPRMMKELTENIRRAAE